jgi:hypothetical protein
VTEHTENVFTDFSIQKTIARTALNYSEENIEMGCLPNQLVTNQVESLYRVSIDEVDGDAVGGRSIQVGGIEGALDFMNACGNLMRITGDKDMSFSSPSGFAEEILDLWLELDKASFEKASEHFGCHPASRVPFDLKDPQGRQSALNFWVAACVLEGFSEYAKFLPNIYRVDELSKVDTSFILNRERPNFQLENGALAYPATGFGIPFFSSEKPQVVFSEQEVASTISDLLDGHSMEDSDRKFYSGRGLSTIGAAPRPKRLTESYTLG